MLSMSALRGKADTSHPRTSDDPSGRSAQLRYSHHCGARWKQERGEGEVPWALERFGKP